jgi:hypothetical protein
MSGTRKRVLPKAVKKLLEEGWALDSNSDSTIRILRKGSQAITYNVETGNVSPPWTWLNSDWNWEQDQIQSNLPQN